MTWVPWFTVSAHQPLLRQAFNRNWVARYIYRSKISFSMFHLQCCASIYFITNYWRSSGSATIMMPNNHSNGRWQNMQNDPQVCLFSLPSMFTNRAFTQEKTKEFACQRTEKCSWLDYNFKLGHGSRESDCNVICFKICDVTWLHS